jgi:hypothetical protein
MSRLDCRARQRSDRRRARRSGDQSGSRPTASRGQRVDPSRFLAANRPTRKEHSCMTRPGTRRPAAVEPPARSGVTVPSRIASHLRGLAIVYLALFVGLGGTSYAASSLKPGSSAEHVRVSATQAGGWPTTPSAISRFSQGFVSMERGYAALTNALKSPPLPRTGRSCNPVGRRHLNGGPRRCQRGPGTHAARHSARVH